MLFREICVCVCLAMVLSLATAVDPNARDWTSVYCSPTGLEAAIKKKDNAKSVTEYERALKQWNNTDAPLKTDVAKMIKAKDLKTFAVDKFAKIPMACLLRLPLKETNKGITLAQTLKVAELGNTKMVEDAVMALSSGDKTQFLTNVLAPEKPSKTTPYKSILLGEIKRTIGRALLTDVVAKVNAAECPYLAGAMENAAITKPQFETLSAKVVTKSCTLDMAGVERMATKVLDLYKDIAAITTTADDIIKYMTPLIPYLSKKNCDTLFSTARMTAALSKAAKITSLNLKALDGKWRLDKCQGGMSSPCLMTLKELIGKTPDKVTDANWDSLGAVASFLDPSVITATLKTYTDTSPLVKRCVKFKLYQLYEFRGKDLNTALQMLVSQCTKEEPISTVTDWSKQKVDATTKGYAGYIPFFPLSRLEGANGLPKAVLCNTELFTIFNKVVQYGKSETIKTTCDKYFDTTTPVPKQKSCRPSTPPGEKPEGSMAHPGIDTAKVHSVDGATAEKLVTNPNTRRTVEALVTADACTIVKKATTTNAEMFYEAIKSPLLTKCYSVETSVTKSKTENNIDKMGMANFNKATQLGIFADLNKTKTVDKWTDADIDRNVRVVPMVITPKIVNMMTAEAFVIATKMSHVSGKIMSNTIDAVLDRVTAFLAISDSADPLKPMTVAQADQLGPLMTYIKNPDVSLKNAIAGVKAKYCDKMSERMAAGGDPMCRMLPDLAKVYTFCKANKVPTLTGGKWTAANVASMGNLACHIPKADVEAMAVAEFKMAIATFSACEFMAAPTKEAFIAMVKNKDVYGSDPARWTIMQVATLGQSLKFFPQADLDKIKKDVYKDLNLLEENDDCIKAKYGKEEKGYEVLVKAMHKVLTAVSTGTATLTYDELNPRPDSYMKLLTVDQIKAIPGEDFKALYRRFASINEWSKDQQKELLTQIKSAKVANQDKICKFTAAELINTGNLVTLMTVEDIKCFDFKTASDKATPLSSLVGWTEDQYKELAAYYKANTSLTVKSMDETKIMYLGSFMCGLNDTDIGTVPAGTLKKSMSMVVDLYVNCNHTKLVALLKVAQQKEAYGPIAKWTSTIVAEVGVIIAGVNKTEIAALDTLIADVPVDILEKIDSETIKYMTDAAKKKLPADVRKELKVDDKKASAAIPVFNGMFLLLTILVTAQLY
ncbi:uncharacterized protein LOC135487427 isoform X2 [Lineus longissimus]|uniref:uncharacterized protein LOC135487427 isoform X2 n=1 Tax=Lineus longissimus TaxID=88925 RepID=UPI002B4F67D6